MAEEKHKTTNNDIEITTKKTKHQVPRIPLKTGVELRCSGRTSSSYSTCDTRCVTLVANPVISHEWGKVRIVTTTNGTYRLSYVIQILRNGNQP